MARKRQAARSPSRSPSLPRESSPTPSQSSSQNTRSARERTKRQRKEDEFAGKTPEDALRPYPFSCLLILI